MKRALVIGSQTGGLSGVVRDAERMADTLGALGFTADRVLGPAATREGILAAYRRLIRDSEPGDAAVFYYAGHGTLAKNPGYLAAKAAGRLAPRYIQFLVPADFAETGEHDFRGIASQEISVLLAALTDKTQNVTVLLDCCHAARMLRDPGLRPRALPNPITTGVEPFLERLEREGVDLGRLDVEGNPHAVRLVAAGVRQSAYEYTNDAGESAGIMTEALVGALGDPAALSWTWREVLRRVRERVQRVTDEQRPEVEGPHRRILFTQHERHASSMLPPPPAAPPAAEITWGVVEEGSARPLAGEGARVTVGQRIYVRIENPGDEPVYASVFDVGVTGEVTLLTVAEPSGVEIAPGEDYVLGYREGRGFRGLALTWPRGVPDDGPRPGSLVVFVSREPEDLRIFEAHPQRLAERTPAARIAFLLASRG